jgi:hypothetical protein
MGDGRRVHQVARQPGRAGARPYAAPGELLLDASSWLHVIARRPIGWRSDGWISANYVAQSACVQSSNRPSRSIHLTAQTTGLPLKRYAHIPRKAETFESLELVNRSSWISPSKSVQLDLHFAYCTAPVSMALRASCKA